MRQPVWRHKLITFVEGAVFQNTVMLLICLNAIVLGVETLPVGRNHAELLNMVDQTFISFFILELVLRITAYGPAFFRSGWNIADFLIIVTSALTHATGVAAFRAFRILRLLRVVTVIPRMRLVVKALFDAIPGIVSVALVALLIVYVFAVIASTLYGPTHPALFGDVFTSMYTLFQVITLEGWRDIADEVSEDHKYAWAFFVIFVLVGTFTMLNLFIAIVVRVVEDEADETEDLVRDETNLILDKIAIVADRLDTIEQKVDGLSGSAASSPDASR
ncbi:ion transporter [Parvularcula sp. LCG005]|uniref:ion transporter n=1 Tax=Parvularcula sp. LCG005 TaxID=3078805 RepID=UPI0029426D19|nr:ion transporter [Parvularcula sp. LCG005]WOI54131.1 ion transporter [Parvularcula sp. LCG005]